MIAQLGPLLVELALLIEERPFLPRLRLAPGVHLVVDQRLLGLLECLDLLLPLEFEIAEFVLNHRCRPIGRLFLQDLLDDEGAVLIVGGRRKVSIEIFQAPVRIAAIQLGNHLLESSLASSRQIE